jgi:hypothetical protein
MNALGEISFAAFAASAESMAASVARNCSRNFSAAAAAGDGGDDNQKLGISHPGRFGVDGVCGERERTTLETQGQEPSSSLFCNFFFDAHPILRSTTYYSIQVPSVQRLVSPHSRNRGASSVRRVYHYCILCVPVWRGRLLLPVATILGSAPAGVGTPPG